MNPIEWFERVMLWIFGIVFWGGVLICIIGAIHDRGNRDD